MDATNLPTHSIAAIAIGASAGGVEALLKLLPVLSRDAQISVFVVLHLLKEQRSLLPDIFQPRCQLPVREADDHEPVASGTIYFAPSDYHLLIDDGPVLALSADDDVNFSRPSIDVLFESAADVYGNRLLGIILSGGNDDGVAGLQSIQQAGGITIAQQPAEAYATYMPTAAIERGAADHVFTLEEIAVLLRRFGKPSNPQTGAGA